MDLKKKNPTVPLFFAIFALFGLSACGKSYTGMYDPYAHVSSAYLDELKTGQNPEIVVVIPEISEEDIQSRIDSNLATLNEQIEVSDRPVADGDTVNIDFVGKLDGVAFEGGTAEGFDLVIGSGSFIDGFEDGLIGAQTGETLDLTLTFPENYASADLAGQTTVFTVTVNKITETKTYELTDETAHKLDETINTADEYRNLIKDTLVQESNDSYNTDIGGHALTQLVEEATFTDIPQDIIEGKKDAFRQNATTMLGYYAQIYGVTTDQMIVQVYGGADAFEETVEENGQSNARRYFMVMAIAKTLGYEVKYQDIKAYAENNAAEGTKPSEFIESSGGEQAVAENILRTRVEEYLTEHASLG